MRKALASQQPRGTGTADFTRTVDNHRASTVEAPVFIAQGINRNIECPGEAMPSEICRRADIEQLATTGQQIFSSLGR